MQWDGSDVEGVGIDGTGADFAAKDLTRFRRMQDKMRLECLKYIWKLEDIL